MWLELLVCSRSEQWALPKALTHNELLASPNLDYQHQHPEPAWSSDTIHKQVSNCLVWDLGRPLISFNVQLITSPVIKNVVDSKLLWTTEILNVKSWEMSRCRDIRNKFWVFAPLLKSSGILGLNTSVIARVSLLFTYIKPVIGCSPTLTLRQASQPIMAQLNSRHIVSHEPGSRAERGSKLRINNNIQIRN